MSPAGTSAGARPYLSGLGGESSRKLLYDGPAGAAWGAAPGLGRTALRGAVTILAARDAELSSAACSTGQDFSPMQGQMLWRLSSAAPPKAEQEHHAICASR